jgi:hypothetical protein
MTTGMLEIAQRFILMYMLIAINVKGMSFKIEGYRKIIAISKIIGGSI